MVLLAAAPGRGENSETAQGDEAVEVMVIVGQGSTSLDSASATDGPTTPSAPDTAALLRAVPGAAVVSNGPLGGQVQYRGMFGDRVSVRIDGAVVATGGPNWMDPPLHYAPRALLESLEVKRGIAAVSEGSETIGSSVQTRLKSSHFGEDASFRPQADLQFSGRSVDASFSGGGLVGVANDSQRFHLLGSAESGGNMRVQGGRVRPTEFERYQYGGGYGLRRSGFDLSFDYRYNDTRNSGNPSLPMDTRFVRTHLGKIGYQGVVGDATVDGHFSLSNVDHRMDNFGLRKAPMPAMFRRADAEAEAYGFDLRAQLPLQGGTLRFGTEWHLTQHDMRISNPNLSNPSNAAFFVTNFNDVRRDRYSLFVQWNGELGEIFRVEGGLRYTLVSSDAGAVDALPAQMLPPPGRLRDRFNAADRDEIDHLVDVVVKLALEPWQGWRFELGAARKTRAPSYLERYAWLPLEVTGGLADGNNYVGEIGLEPEVAHEIDGGFEWRWQGIGIAPRAFYRRVENYIQGTPSGDADVIMVSGLNGDATPLAYSNVSAEFYGVDATYRAQLPLDFELDGVFSFVRARRRDIDDNLYRIAPVNGRTTLRYLREHWSAGIEGVYAGAQRKVSRTNGEATTGAWGEMNLFGTLQPLEAVALEFGVDNLLDDRHANHLAGTSRVTSSGVTAGERLPAAGRSFYGRVSGRF